MDSEITIVSGLPRSGTSLMMQMLDFGGMEVVTDNIRTADADNPRGYYEYEIVKKIKQDVSWLPATRGKAFKMISQLLYDLPPTERYHIIFMERDMDETVRSQEKMLERLGKKAAPSDQIKGAFAIHLNSLKDWLRKQKNIEVLYISYNDLLAQPQEQAERVSGFLGGKANANEMVRAVDPALYRNRRDLGQEGIPDDRKAAISLKNMQTPG